MRDKIGRSWSWRSRLPDLSAAIARFPLAVVIAGLLTLYLLYYSPTGDPEERIAEGLAASFLWVVAVDFYVESIGRSRLTRILLWLGGIAGVSLLFWFAWDIWLNAALLLGALVLAIGLSAHLGHGERNASFWLFNHRLWLGAVLALIGAGLFGAGLSIILETLNFLFGLELPSRWHNYIWTVSMGFIAPVSWLAFAPRAFTEPVGAKATEFTERAVAAIVKFVLVPVLLVYTGILYAYAIKIALEGVLPKGTLASMVVGYVLTGASTLLLAYPSRESGGVLVRLFWRYWVWLALMPVLLLFLAAYRRIEAYGLTEQRYMIVLIGVWALILAATRILRGSSLDLRFVPGLLAILLLAASFGPGGAIGFSVMSQKSELQSILQSKGLLVDGKIVARSESGEAAKGREADNALGTDAARVRGIEWYLNEHHELHMLAPWFEDQTASPFAPDKPPEQTARELLAALGLRPDVPSSPGTVYFTHYSDEPAVVALTADSHVIGPVVFQSGGPVPGPIPSQSVTVEGLGTVRLDLADNALTARSEDGGEIHFNIMEAAKELANPLSKVQRPLLLHGAGKGLVGTVLIDNLNGAYKEPDFDLSLVRFWLVLGRAP
jgi:Domain of unknown function (DUF4153)